MIRHIKNKLRSSLFKLFDLAGLEKISIMNGLIRSDQILKKDFLEDITEAEFSIFSQWGEDGIISWLISIINPKSKKFIEFGVEDFRESNCRYLIQTRNWSGLVIDGSQENIQSIRSQDISWRQDLKSHAEFINKDNINEIIHKNDFNGDIGLLSTDIDGVDYYVLKEIDNNADIIVVEYNDLFSGRAVSVPYDSNFQRHNAHYSGTYWGASLEAFIYLLEGKDYIFIGTNSIGTNAFFIKKNHEMVVTSKLKHIKKWPCKIRDVRDKNGDLLFQDYHQSWHLIKDMPLVDVTSNEVLKVEDLFKK